MAIDRRQFLIFGGGALAAGGAAYLALSERDPSPSIDLTVIPQEPTRQPTGSDLVISPGGVLPKQHAMTLSSVMDRIYPSEPGSAGALDVGAFDYLIEQLRRRDMQVARRVLMRGATQANRVSVRLNNAVFMKAEPAQRDAVLTAMYGGEGQRGSFDPKEFIQFMTALTLEGMFAHPVYGGNRDGMG
ncbi:MAG: gluconate 2-dehydrogenase subunit 3 family protein, partial [Myxococcota bacterium]